MFPWLIPLSISEQMSLIGALGGCLHDLIQPFESNFLPFGFGHVLILRSKPDASLNRNRLVELDRRKK